MTTRASTDLHLHEPAAELGVLRREPFRLFFPLGLAIASAGVVPWVLFGRGVIRTWPGPFHAVSMTQGFLLAVAVGFLGTMIPRRTGTSPFAAADLALLGIGVGLIPVLSWVEPTGVAAQVAFLVVVGLLGGWMISRLRAVRSPRPVPPSFVLLPVGVLAGVTGAVMQLAAQTAGLRALAAPGRTLAEQGLLLGLVLALVPMLHPIIATGTPPADRDARARRRQTAVHLAAAALFLGSFAVEAAGAVRAGLLLRGGVCAAELAWSFLVLGGAWRPGLHRRVFQLSILFVPMGLLAAGLTPSARVPNLHLTYVAGLSLMVLAVTVHVSIFHGGDEAVGDRRPWPVAVAAALVIAAALVRFVAERAFGDYFVALTLSAALWLAATLVWGGFLASLRPGKKLSVPGEHGAYLTLAAAVAIALVLSPDRAVAAGIAVAVAASFLARGPVDRVAARLAPRPWDVGALALLGALAGGGVFVAWQAGPVAAGAAVVLSGGVMVTSALAKRARVQRSAALELAGLFALGASGGIAALAAGAPLATGAAAALALALHAALAVPMTRAALGKDPVLGPGALALVLLGGALALAFVAPSAIVALAPRTGQLLARALAGVPSLRAATVGWRETVLLVLAASSLLLVTI